jgi:hypothetical protein
MTEHKFTDDEIIKGMNAYTERMCNKCNVKDLGTCCGSCFITIISQGADLINRQKAENSNLTSDLTSLQNDLTSAKSEIWALKETLAGRLSASAVFAIKEAEAKGKAMVHSLKAEAIKEFAEIIVSDYPEMEYYLTNLAKEMTEGES